MSNEKQYTTWDLMKIKLKHLNPLRSQAKDLTNTEVNNLMIDYANIWHTQQASEMQKEYERITRELKQKVETIHEYLNQNEKLQNEIAGLKQQRAILEVETGKEYLVFPQSNMEHVEEFLNYLNNKNKMNKKEQIEEVVNKFILSYGEEPNDYKEVFYNSKKNIGINLFTYLCDFAEDLQKPEVKESDAGIVNIKDIEFTIRNILSLHLNNFYQENGLSVSCKSRTKAEDKIIASLFPIYKELDIWINILDDIKIDEYLCYINGDIEVCRFDGENWYNIYDEIRCPTHYKLLPSPPIQTK